MAITLERLQEAIAGRYALDREIGRGGMAVVYLATDRTYRRQVAVKVLLPDVALAIGPARFRREIDLATRVSHPHILPLLDSGEVDGALYYVMPFVAGESLRQRLDREHQLGVEEAVRLAAEVADGLEHAHRQGIVHRDIKPENILLEDGHALVADFGIARAAALAGEERLTQTGVTLGTPLYMSPEQAMAERDIDARSDVYSLGCVLYEMLSGRPPFTGPTGQSIIARHALEPVAPLTIVRRTVPPELEEVVQTALAKVPADRFQTADEFARALRAPPGTGPRRRRTRLRAGARRPRMWARSAALVVMPLLLAGGSWEVWRRWRPAAVVADGALSGRRLAVLYFRDETPDGSLGYLADGFTEALTAELRAVQGLSVVSTGGAETFRGSLAAPDSIARVLQVGTLVSGGIRREGDQLRLSVRLVDGASGVDFARSSIAAPAGNLLGIRDTLAQRVAEMIRTRLGQEVRLRTEQEDARTPEAWALLQRARVRQRAAEEAITAGDTAAVLRAVANGDTLLAAAERLDPQWLEPTVLRGTLAYRASRFFGQDPLRAASWITTGLGHAGRALERDPQSADALALRGTLRYWRWLLGLEPVPARADALLASARADLEGAVRIAPSQAAAWSVLSHLYYQVNDVVESKLAARRAYEEDAFLATADVILWRLFAVSYDLEQFPEAIRWCDEGQRRFSADPRFAECRLYLLGSRAVAPDVGRAWRVRDSLVALSPQGARAYAALNGQVLVAAVLARAALADSARAVLARSPDRPDLDPTLDIALNAGYAWNLLGDRTRAIQALARYLAANPARAKDVNDDNNWRWRNLRDDPRFVALVKQAQ